MSFPKGCEIQLVQTDKFRYIVLGTIKRTTYTVRCTYEWVRRVVGEGGIVHGFKV